MDAGLCEGGAGLTRLWLPAGRDASRALATGDFSPAGLVDDVSELSPAELAALRGWVDFYSARYTAVGRDRGAVRGWGTWGCGVWGCGVWGCPLGSWGGSRARPEGVWWCGGIAARSIHGGV